MVKFDVTNIPWEKVRKPSSKFKLFEPTKEKLDIISKYLMEGYLNMSDDNRTPTTIFRLMNAYFFNPNNLIYEIDDMQGLFGFTAIVPQWKADVLFKLFNKNIWKHSLLKEGKGLVEFIMDTFKLRRVSTETADIRIVRMAKMIDFKEEGFKECGFVFDNKFYDRYLLGIVRNN